MNDDDVDYFLEETISGAELKIPLALPTKENRFW